MKFRQIIPEPADGKEVLGEWKREVVIPATRNSSQQRIGKKLALACSLSNEKTRSWRCRKNHRTRGEEMGKFLQGFSVSRPARTRECPAWVTDREHTCISRGLVDGDNAEEGRNA